MESRRRAREAALQALYMLDSLDNWEEGQLSFFLKIFFPHEDSLPDLKDNALFWYTLTSGVRVSRDTIDQRISAASTRWSISRMARVDRNILRVAVYELLYCPDIPQNVSINEAIEVAKRFGSDDSPMFINGVLDSVAAAVRATACKASGTEDK